MGAIFFSWAISGVVLLGFAVVLGLAANSRIDGILIDHRGCYSLTQFQVCLWTITIISLLSGVFFGRLFHGVTDPLNIVIPSRLLLLLGIVLGSGVTATGIKRAKDITRPENVAASGGTSPPRLMQMFLNEEGASAGEAVDIAKFQGFVITILLVISYISVTVNAINAAGTAQLMTSLPSFNGQSVLVLLGISQGAYVTGKIPNSAGEPYPSVWDRNSDPSAFRVQKRSAGKPKPAPRAPAERPSRASQTISG